MRQGKPIRHAMLLVVLFVAIGCGSSSTDVADTETASDLLTAHETIAGDTAPGLDIAVRPDLEQDTLPDPDVPDPKPDTAVPTQCASSNVIQADPSSYKGLLSKLKPCDVLQLEAGNYPEGLPLTELNGEPGKPIIISGPQTGKAAIFSGRNCCNTVSIRDSSYLVIRNLTLDGKGNDGDGVKAEGNSTFAHHITLENLTIIGHGKNQQIVGISTKCPAWNWIIRRNRIVGAGTGMYLGNSDGRSPFVNGLIEHNVIVDTLGYNMQIKHQIERPKLSGVPTSGETVIRHNVFSKQNHGSTGDSARPNLLVGHWPPAGPGSNDRYLIYGNFFHQNPTENLFQGEGNLALYNNVLLNDSGGALSIQAHNDVPKRIHVFYNTIVANGTGISISGADTSFPQLVTGNAVFAVTPLKGGDQSENITGTYSSAANLLLNPSGSIGSLSLFPSGEGLKGSTMTLAPFNGFVQWNQDFNGTLRSGQWRGAYVGNSGDNPGWKLALDFKPDP